MGRTIGGIAAIIALAVAAFSAAYFGGGLLTKAPAVEPAGAALRAPALAVSGTPIALQTPTATPSPTPTATPKPKKKHKKKKVTTTPKRRYTATPVPTRVATAVPTRAPVYHPPVKTPKPAKTPGIIIED